MIIVTQDHSFVNSDIVKKIYASKIKGTDCAAEFGVFAVFADCMWPTKLGMYRSEVDADAAMNKILAAVWNSDKAVAMPSKDDPAPVLAQ